MSVTSPDTRPDVTAFVAAVRALLADLPEDTREELLDGFEADLGEQVAEAGPGVLGDAAAYVAELRAAAGLPMRRRRTRLKVPSAAGASTWLGVATARVSTLVGQNIALRFGWSVLEPLRPAWWVLRAWVMLTALDQAVGPNRSVVLLPRIDAFGLHWMSPMLLVVAIAVSVLIGQNRAWPGSGPSRRLSSRVVLLGLNALVVLLPLGFTYGPESSLDNPGFSAGYRQATSDRGAGLSVKGRLVTNLFAYDLAGNPIEGVQLFDQDGRPVTLSTEQSIAGSGAQRTVGCPWFNGTIALRQVFPLQQQVQRGQACDAGGDAANPIQAPTAPLAQVPPVTRTPAP